MKKIFFTIIFIGFSFFKLSAQEQIVNSTIDKICFETAKFYIEKMNEANPNAEPIEFPENFKSYQDLLDFLSKIYPNPDKKSNILYNEKHELLIVLGNISYNKIRYKKNEKGEQDIPIKEYLSSIVNTWLKFKTFKTNELKDKLLKDIESIKVEQVSNDNTTVVKEKQENSNKDKHKQNEIKKEKNANNDSVGKVKDTGIDWFATSLLIILILSIIGIIAFIFYRQYAKIKTIEVQNKEYQNTIALLQKQIVKPEPNTLTTTNIQSTPVSHTISETQNTNNNKTNLISQRTKWLVVGESVIGKSHIDSNIPCQDNHFIEQIDNFWGVAISCDGAGSAKQSHIGSKVVSQIAGKIFKELVTNKGWNQNNFLPSESEWNLVAKDSLKRIYVNLQTFAKEKNLNLPDLACTIIVTIYSPVGLLVTHIGDGRAGYCTHNQTWFSSLTPHKGEESNQTIFLTSIQWLSENFQMSGVNVPECRVIKEKTIAFTLMSDGCESHTFECSKLDSLTNKWSDPNKPSEKLFNSLIATLNKDGQNNVDYTETKSKWKKYLESGNQGLMNEPDDKTMILGVLL